MSYRAAYAAGDVTGTPEVGAAALQAMVGREAAPAAALRRYRITQIGTARMVADNGRGKPGSSTTW